MYPSVTSDKAILQASRTLLQEQGWTALNIRSVAAACGVSVGSIYNRFGSKSQLVAATVESIWQEIFCLPQDPGEGRRSPAKCSPPWRPPAGTWSRNGYRSTPPRPRRPRRPSGC